MLYNQDQLYALSQETLDGRTALAKVLKECQELSRARHKQIDEGRLTCQPEPSGWRVSCSHPASYMTGWSLRLASYPYNCGICIVYGIGFNGLETNIKEILQLWFKYIFEYMNYSCIEYTISSSQPLLLKVLLELDFKVVHEFKNTRSGHKVSILELTK